MGQGQSLATGLFRHVFGDYHSDLWPPRYDSLKQHWCLDYSKEQTLHFCHDLSPTSPEHDPAFDYSVFTCHGAHCQVCVDLDPGFYPSRERWRVDGSMRKDPKSREIHCTWGSLMKSQNNDGCDLCDILVKGILKIYDGPELTDDVVFCVELLEGFTVRVTLERLSNDENVEFVHKFSVEFHTGLNDKSQNSNLPRAFGPATELKRDIEVADCVAFIRKRVDDCKAHSNCLPQDNSSNLPTRVIDVGTGKHDVRLEIHPKHGELCTTLSHVWGPPPSKILMTTTNNIQQHCNNISWSSLTRTFQDAVSVTRGLGIRYLWIDSICIIQDSPSDWKVEAAQMSRVYMNSYLTLAATSNHDTSGGLLNPRCTLNERRQAVDIEEHQLTFPSSSSSPFSSPNTTNQVFARRTLKRSHFYLLTFDHDLLHSSRAPLLQRAWCLQERLLSSRTIHFCLDEMLWECKSGIICECGYASSLSGKAESDGLIGRNVFRDLFNELHLPSDGKEKEKVKADEEDEEFLKAWYRLIEYYVTLKITFPTDRLPALGGLTRILEEKMGWKYKDGLWMNDFVRGALFRVDLSCRRSEGVPSWSWASLISYSGSTPDSYIKFPALDKEWIADRDFRLVSYDVGNGDLEEKERSVVVVEAAYLDATVICVTEKSDPKPEETEGDASDPEGEPDIVDEIETGGSDNTDATNEPSPQHLATSIQGLDINEGPPLASSTSIPETTPEPEPRQPEEPTIITKLQIANRTETISVDWDINDSETHQKAEIEEGGEVLILKLAHWPVEDVMMCHGLVLKSNGDGWYRRVGMFSAKDELVFRERREVGLY